MLGIVKSLSLSVYFVLVIMISGDIMSQYNTIQCNISYLHLFYVNYAHSITHFQDIVCVFLMVFLQTVDPIKSVQIASIPLKCMHVR